MVGVIVRNRLGRPESEDDDVFLDVSAGGTIASVGFDDRGVFCLSFFRFLSGLEGPTGIGS